MTRSYLALGVVLALGLALRIAHLEEVRRAPDFAHPAVDALTHHYWARGLATGDWTPPAGAEDPRIPATAFFRPPGYPYFLAALYRVAGVDPWVPRIAQVLLGLTSAVLAFLVGRRVYGNLAGLVAAALLSFTWSLVYFEGELQATSLLVLLALLGLLLLERGVGRERRRLLFVAGFVWGLGALVRPSLLATLPVAVIYAIAMTPASRRQRVVAAGVLLLGTVAGILPATLRNAVVAGEFVPISTNAGINLYMGNHPQARGVVMDEIPGLGSFGTCFDYPALQRRIESLAGRRLSGAETSRWLTQRALEFIRQDPKRVTGLALRKLRDLWAPLELGHNKEVHFERAASPWLKHLPGFPLAAALGLLGFLLQGALSRPSTPRPTGTRKASPAGEVRAASPQARAFTALLAGCVVAYTLSLLPFFVAERYRVPMLPWLALLGGAAVSWGALAWHVGPRRRVVLAAAGGAALFTLLHRLPSSVRPNPSQWHFQRGVAYLAADDTTRAESAFQEAIALQPDNVRALHNLATLRARRGDLQAAIELWERAAARRPDQAPVQLGLGAALLAAGRPREALAPLERARRLDPAGVAWREPLAQAHFGVARALQDSNAVTAAVRHFQAAVEAGGTPRWANNAAWWLATHPRARDARAALALIDRATRSDDTDHPSYLDTRAAALAADGQFEAALRTLQRAIQLTAAAGGDTTRMAARRLRYRKHQPFLTELQAP